MLLHGLCQGNTCNWPSVKRISSFTVPCKKKSHPLLQNNDIIWSRNISKIFAGRSQTHKFKWRAIDGNSEMGRILLAGHRYRTKPSSTALPLLAAAVDGSQQHPGRAGDTLGFRLFYYLLHMYRHLCELKQQNWAVFTSNNLSMWMSWEMLPVNPSQIHAWSHRECGYGRSDSTATGRDQRNSVIPLPVILGTDLFFAWFPDSL